MAKHKCKYCDSGKLELETRQVGTNGMTTYQYQCKKCYQWQPVKLDPVQRAFLH